jgi:CheY-like chemotaxis protein
LNSKILIVDDEKFNCDIIEGFLMVLQMPNYQQRTDQCYNGETAVEKVKAAIEDNDPYRYRLILMDICMPFLDGYGAAMQIRKLWQKAGIRREFQPTIVAISGHVEQEHIIKAMEHGMDRAYIKPLPLVEFAKLLISANFIKELPEQLRIGTDADED